jgi:hypothetical protein
LDDLGLLEGFTLFVLLCLLGVPLVLFTRRHKPNMKHQVRLFLVAFGLRFFVSFLLYGAGLSNLVGDEDAKGWTLGASLHHDWLRHGVSILDLPGVLLDAFSGHHRGYGFFLGGIFYVTSAPYRMTAAVLNCFVGALTVLLAYRIARSLFSEFVATRVGWWTALLPSMVIWSAQTIKEPVVIFLETVALYGCIRLRESGFSMKHLFICAVSIVLLIPFRFYGCYIVGAAVLVALMTPGLSGLKGWVSGLAIIAVLGPILLGSGLFALHEAAAERFDIASVQKFRMNVSQGGKGQGAGSGVKTADIRTSEGFVTGVAVGAAHLLLAPFPWQLTSARAMFTLPEVMYWWFLFFRGVVPGVIYSLRHRFRDITVLLLFIFGFGLLYSMMFGNVGLVVRQRAQLLPWLLIFAAVGIERSKIRHAAAIAKRKIKLVISHERQTQTIPAS